MQELHIKIDLNYKEITNLIETLTLLQCAMSPLESEPVTQAPPAPVNRGMMSHPDIAKIEKPPLADDGQVDLGLTVVNDEPKIQIPELDVDGLPWDRRIHTEKKIKNSDGSVTKQKTKNDDGRWRIKRGTDKDLITQVKAELKAMMDLPTPPAPLVVNDAAPPVPVVSDAAIAFAESTVTQAPPVPVVSDAAIAFAESTVTQAPPVPVVSDAAATVVSDPLTMLQFIQKTTQRIAEKRAFIDRLNDVLTEKGVPSLPALQSREDILPTINAQLDLIWTTM